MVNTINQNYTIVELEFTTGTKHIKLYEELRQPFLKFIVMVNY